MNLPPFAIATLLIILALNGREPLKAQIKNLPGNVPLVGTRPLTITGDLSVAMQDGAHQFIQRVIDETPHKRAALWQRNTSSPTLYAASVTPQRTRLRQIVGVIDQRSDASLQQWGTDLEPPLVAQSPSVRAYQVRWAVLDQVWAEGLLLIPNSSPPTAAVVTLPDATQQPEQIAGLSDPATAWARQLAESGVVVLIPTLIDRSNEFVGNPFVVANYPGVAKPSDQTHREWIYRQAFHMGRHVIGYEIQKILAAVDWFEKYYGPHMPIGVAGYGEGGLLAFYASACDDRIDSAFVSGYLDSRQQLWDEPIDRNLFGLLREFGDAEIASLIAPRPLFVEHSKISSVTGQKGSISTPPDARVAAEVARAKTMTAPLAWQLELITQSGQACDVPCRDGLARWAQTLGVTLVDHATLAAWADLRKNFDAPARQQRTVQEIESHVQTLVRQSSLRRDNRFLGKLMPEHMANSRGGAWFKTETVATQSASDFAQQAEPFRAELWTQVLGKIEEPRLPPQAKTRAIYEHPQWTAYEVVLDVYTESFAWGILVVPKHLPQGVRRPVVVCQHGLESIPQDVVLPGQWVGISDFAGKLAERGFVTFAPHNLYRHGDRFRTLQRKANSVGLTLYSLTIAHHAQILDWLKSLDFVDPHRLAFYGISYGGTTALFVPSILTDYCLSICTANLNDWTRKVAGTEDSGYMYSGEWEMPYFNMGNTFSHAEMAYLIAPRPFMVERGHHDAVARDSQVAAEYAKIAWLYAQLGIADRTEIEFFQGGHCIHGQGTFRFLHHHLQLAEP